MKAYETVDAAYVEREIGHMPLVDVRPPLFYQAGHIPTAVNVRLDKAAASSNPPQALAKMLQDDGIFPDDEVIVYCKMGVHAKIACDYLAQAGYGHLHRYAGSMDDWSSDPRRPIEYTDGTFARAS